MAYKKKKPAHRKNPKRVAAGKKAAKTRARNKRGYSKKKSGYRKEAEAGLKAGKKAAAARRKGYSKRRRSARMDGARCVACGHVVYGVGGRAPSNAKLKAHYKRKHQHATYGWTTGLTTAQHKKFRAKYARRRPFVPPRQRVTFKGVAAQRARLEKAYAAAHKRYSNAFHQEMLWLGKNPGHAMLESEMAAIRARPRVFPLWVKSRAAFIRMIALGRSKSYGSR